MEKVEKDILTKENIIKDLLKFESGVSSKKTDWFFPLFTSLAGIAIISGLLLQRLWVGLVLGLLPVACIVILIIQLQPGNKIRQEIKNGNFTVTTDTLNSITEEEIVEPRIGSGSTRTVRFLNFNGFSWRMLGAIYYPWSELYHMSPQGIVNTSCEGDEFYIAILTADTDVCYVYNTKFFRYRGDDF